MLRIVRSSAVRIPPTPTAYCNDLSIPSTHYMQCFALLPPLVTPHPKAPSLPSELRSQNTILLVLIITQHHTPSSLSPPQSLPFTSPPLREKASPSPSGAQRLTYLQKTKLFLGLTYQNSSLATPNESQKIEQHSSTL